MTERAYEWKDRRTPTEKRLDALETEVSELRSLVERWEHLWSMAVNFYPHLENLEEEA